MKKWLVTFALLLLFSTLFYIKFNKYSNHQLWQKRVETISNILELITIDDIKDSANKAEQINAFRGYCIINTELLNALTDLNYISNWIGFESLIELNHSEARCQSGFERYLEKFRNNDRGKNLYDSLPSNRLKEVVKLTAINEMVLKLFSFSRTIICFHSPYLRGMQDSYNLYDTLSFSVGTRHHQNDFGFVNILEQIKVQDSVYSIENIKHGILEHHFTAEKGTHRVPVQMIVETECGLDTIQKTYTVNVH